MRIGVDVRCIADGGRTGIEEYTVGVLSTMIRIAPEDTFVLFSNSRKQASIPSFPGSNVEYRFFRYPNKLFTAVQKTAGLPRLDRLLQADVLFVPGVRLIPRTVRVPIVSTFHDLSFIRHPEAFTLRRLWWHRLMNPRMLAQMSSRIIAVSRATAEDVSLLYGVPKSRIRVVYPGIRDILRVSRDGSDARDVHTRYRLPERYILFLGTIEPRKNVDALLDAYRIVREKGMAQHLVIAGRWGWERRSLLRKIEAHPCSQSIHLTGFVEDKDKSALYSLADLFVYPSIYEGFGFPPLEALAAGTPVITSHNSSIPEVVGKWATLINPYDVNELAEVMMERLREPRSISDEVSRDVRTRYSWERAGRETLDVIREVCERR